MELEDYMGSGILEAYVLDALTPQERVAIEAEVAMYPHLTEEITAIENALEQYIAAQAIDPPAHLEEKIWSRIESELIITPEIKERVDTPAAKEVPFTPWKHNATWQRAAIWTILAGSLLTNIIFYSQRKQALSNEIALNNRMDIMRQQQLGLVAQVQHYQMTKDMMADTGMQTIIMHTIKKGHPMAATIYWDKKTGAAYVSVEKLPVPPPGMQYQMWVIQNGKPVDMGMLPNELVAAAGMDKVKMNITDGQAFAISLEKEGGSPTPTAENIFVLGKVSS